MKISFKHSTLLAALLLPTPFALAGVTLTADGQTDTYKLIQSKLNSQIEAPDCAHPGFGPHIKQVYDSALGKSAFAFMVHVTPDNDRCQKSDRQRNEIKVDASSPAGLRTVQGESMKYRWLFKLDKNFQVSPAFTHIHQIKPVGGDEGNPIISLDPRTGSPDVLEVGYYDYNNKHKVLKNAPLDGFRGEWVEVNETLTAGRPGKYGITITRVRDGATLLSYSTGSIDMWRKGNNYLRPKWGIYRSLNKASYLRDETVLFDQFCIAKGSETCSASNTGGGGSAPAPAPAPSSPATAKLSISGSAVSASANDGNLPVNTVDGSLSTRWSANGDGQWIQYDLQAQKTVSAVKVAWYNGSSRKTKFDIQVSSDGKSFKSVYSGQSSGVTKSLENYNFSGVSARYVRIVGHGNTSNSWNSITESEIYGS